LTDICKAMLWLCRTGSFFSSFQFNSIQCFFILFCFTVCYYYALLTCSPVFQLLICSLSFATFSVDKSLPQSRLQLSFTLMLTSVAFKSVVNQSLPRISYLTYMVSSLTCTT
jgi:hypothetical protein